MNDLAARKSLLLAQADLHRQLIALERSRLHSRWHAARAFVGGQRWWLLGGTLLAGVLLARKGRSLARWLPALVTVARLVKSSTSK